MRAVACASLLVGALAAACAPALDWRQVQPAGAGLVIAFPCRPASHARQVRLAQSELRLELHACTAAGVTWALAFAEVGEPARVGPALNELRAAAASNLDATVTQEAALQVPGATPNPSSRRVTLRGRAPDGRPFEEQVALFTKGLRVYQATVLGERIDSAAAEVFFGSLRLGP